MLILTANPPAAHPGQPYSYTPLVGGGAEPYTFELAGGSLPAGMSVNASTGEISGVTDEADGFHAFQMRVTDSLDATAIAAATLVVDPPQAYVFGW